MPPMRSIVWLSGCPCKYAVGDGSIPARRVRDECADDGVPIRPVQLDRMSERLEHAKRARIRLDRKEEYLPEPRAPWYWRLESQRRCKARHRARRCRSW